MIARINATLSGGNCAEVLSLLRLVDHCNSACKVPPAELVEGFLPYKPSAKHPVPIPVPIVEQDKYTYS